VIKSINRGEEEDEAEREGEREKESCYGVIPGEP
jgi:hypothetical protein